MTGLIIIFIILLSSAEGSDSIFTEEELSTMDLEEEVEFANEAHAEVFRRSPFPSAQECRTCHEEHYREWSVSQHAYAIVSPVFNSMQGTILKVTNGTNGDFCIRCHTPVGMHMEEPLFTAFAERNAVAQEGVTCITCHRVNSAYGKVSGRRGILEGPLTDPVVGPTGNEELKRLLADEASHLVTDAHAPGRKVHRDIIPFFQLTTSGFCATCHDVTSPDNLRLEEAFSEFKNTDVAREGVSCQDCHMGRVPGRNEGYAEGSAAVVGGEPTRVRKRTSHYWAGPDHSIVHPGIFPHNPTGQDLATVEQWLRFDWRAGWGSEPFEGELAGTTSFPAEWRSRDDRKAAREIVDGNLELLEWADEQRKTVLKNGYGLGEIEVSDISKNSFNFRIEVRNTARGHNVPTGFEADRAVWLHVLVFDGNGNVVMESGDLDPNGDVRDLHSLYVHDGELPLDDQLFSLQTRFLVRMIRGGEREQVLPLNVSVDPLPFVRRPSTPNILYARPRGARKHKMGIAPESGRWADYHAPVEGPGPYTIQVELKVGMVPINLVGEISHVGFDFGLSPREVAKRIVDKHLVLWQRLKEVEINEVAH